MSLIFLSVAFVLFCVGIGAIVSIFVFVIDVIKWHNSEKRSVIIPSAQILPDELKNDKDNSIESEVNDHAGRDSSCSSVSDRADAGQPNSSAIFSSWLQS